MTRTIKTKTQGEIRSSSQLAEEIRRARKAKRAGITRAEHEQRTLAAIRQAGAAEKWGAASVAMSCADVTIAADEVWDAARVLAERAKAQE